MNNIPGQPAGHDNATPARPIRWVGWLDDHAHILDDRQRGDGPGGQDIYRTRAPRTWSGRWRAQLDYLGAWPLHGDQLLARFTGRSRLDAVTPALDLAATDHATHDP